MAKKQVHEEHQNHEAWAIPYGDLITLLLAFFVVMYAVSSVNEGKYRVLSDALSQAFGGPPRSINPVQVGKISKAGAELPSASNMVRMGRPEQSIGGTMRQLQNPQVIAGKIKTPIPQHQVNASGNTGYAAEKQKLTAIADKVAKALGDLVEKKLVTIRRTEMWVEIEFKTDILYPSGSAVIHHSAEPALKEIAKIVAPYPNQIRIEGHTDNVPIATAQFPSNWELSSARAAGVLHILEREGIDEKRLSVLGMGQWRPKADNATAAGRNINRRVVLVLLAEQGESTPEISQSFESAPAEESAPVAQVPAAPAPSASAGVTSSEPPALAPGASPPPAIDDGESTPARGAP